MKIIKSKAQLFLISIMTRAPVCSRRLTLKRTFPVEELVQELALRAWFHQEGRNVIIMIGGCEHVFGVPHDVDDLQ